MDLTSQPPLLRHHLTHHPHPHRHPHTASLLSRCCMPSISDTMAGTTTWLTLTGVHLVRIPLSHGGTLSAFASACGSRVVLYVCVKGKRFVIKTHLYLIWLLALPALSLSLSLSSYDDVFPLTSAILKILLIIPLQLSLSFVFVMFECQCDRILRIPANVTSLSLSHLTSYTHACHQNMHTSRESADPKSAVLLCGWCVHDGW